MKKILSTILLSTSLLYGLSNEKMGDILRFVIPAGAFGYSYYIGDKEGQEQFLKSTLSTLAITYALKFSVKRERPNHENDRSFPSGHTSITFASSAYIDKRYGFKKAIIPYIASSYVGYSRVQSDNHHTSDVLAGALIGVACSYYFSTKYNNIEISPAISNESIGINFKKMF